MIKKILLGILFLTISKMTFADVRGVGNGGDVVICELSPKEKTIEMLDVYEARDIEKLSFDLGDKELSIEEKLEIALSRLETLAYKIPKVREYVQNFFKEAIFLRDIELKDIPDSQHIVIKKGCKIAQIVIWKEPRFRNQKVYTINKNLWDQLDRDNQTALILHEVIYRLSKHKNSINTRYLVGQLISREVEEFNLEDKFYLIKDFKSENDTVLSEHINFNGLPLCIQYLQNFSDLFFSNGQILHYSLCGRVRDQDFFEYEFNGLTQKINYIGFYNDGSIRFVDFFENQSVQFLGHNIKTKYLGYTKLGNISYVGNDNMIRKEKKIYDVDLILKSLTIDDDENIIKADIVNPKIINFPQYNCLINSISFYSTGEVLSSSCESNVDLLIQEQNIEAYNLVHYKNGLIKKFTSFSSYHLLDINNEQISIEYNDTVYLDKNEKVIKTEN